MWNSLKLEQENSRIVDFPVWGVRVRIQEVGVTSLQSHTRRCLGRLTVEHGLCYVPAQLSPAEI